MGEATVRVKTFNGKENTCKIIVTPEKATSNTYDSMISDLAKVNHNYYNGYEWTVNCQRCVPTYELRRCGYDVTALPNYNEDDIWRTCQDAANKCNGNVWGEIKQHTECSNRQEVENYIRKCGKNTRFQISVKWKAGGAHTFVAEEINGKIYFTDPQSNKIDASSHFNKCNFIDIYRIDNADVSALIDYCYKSNNGKKYQMDQLFK